MVFEKVTFVVSATDETTSLVETVELLVAECKDRYLACILITIPENADTNCIKTIDSLKKKYPLIIRKFVQRNKHIGGALRDSIEEVESSHIMFLSADIPIGLEVVPKMLAEAKKTPDAIIKVSRWLEKDSFYDYSKTRKVFNFCAQKFLSFLFSSSLTDYTCPVLIAPTNIYKELNFKEWGFPCLLEAVLLPLKVGHKFIEIAAKSYLRTEGESKNSWFQTALYLKTAIRVRLTRKDKLLNKKTR